MGLHLPVPRHSECQERTKLFPSFACSCALGIPVFTAVRRSASQDVLEWLETIFGRHGAVCLDPSLGEGTAVGVFKPDTEACDSYFFPQESDPIEEYAQGPMQEVEVSAGSIV